MNRAYIPCAAGIVFDADRRLLMIQRANPPAAGAWSLPGGKSWRGESSMDTCRREVLEETGQIVRVLALAGHVSLDGPNDVVFEVDDYVCAVTGGVLRAGEDASDVQWCTLADLDRLELTPGLRSTLSEWQLLPD